MKENLYNLTKPQEAIYLTEQFYSGTSIGNVGGTLLFKEKVDFNLLEKALNIFVQKNDAARIKLIIENAVPKQYIDEYSFLKIDLVEVKDDKELKKLEKKIISTPFNLLESFLFKFTMVKFPDGTGGYNANFHHIIADAWGMKIFIDQIVEVYSKLVNNEEVNTIPQYSYIEYINREQEYINSDTFKKDKEYWKEKFNTLPELATLSSSNMKSSLMAKREAFKLNLELTNKIKKFCSVNKTSPFSLFVAICSYYLSRVTGLDEIITGTPILNRTNFREKNTFGMLVSTMPFKVSVDKENTFSNYLNNLSKEQLSLLRHQKYHYDYIIEDARKKHSISRSLYDFVISYQNARNNSQTAELKYSTSWMFNGNISESLNIHIYDMDDSGEFSIYYDYLVDVFTKEDISVLHCRLLYILTQVIDNTEIFLKDIEIVTKEEKNKLLYEFNDTKTDYPKDKTIVDLFEEQVEKVPNNDAIEFQGEILTYNEFNKRVNQLARYIQEKGVKEKDIVAILGQKSIDLYVAIMATIKLGAMYVPVDVEYPEERINVILKDCNPKVVLADEVIAKVVEHKNVCTIPFKELSNYEGTNLSIEYKIKPEDAAYIIYTSGTTGMPKGVVIPHKGVVRLVRNTNYIQLNENDRIMQTVAVVFDGSIFEIFGAFLNGLPLYVIRKENLLDFNYFENYIKENKISIITISVSLFNKVVEYNPKIFAGVRVVIIGGEEALAQTVNTVKRETPNVELINGYGPSENTDYSCCHKIEKEYDLKVPIGKPVSNSTCYILDKNMNVQPMGVIGEIYVGGDGLAIGYLNRPELTKERFVENIFEKGSLLYKTGDLGYWLPDGAVQYMGRIDSQVKLRGYRIELKEIESKLLEYGNIKECAVIIIEESQIKKLVAYVVAEKKINTIDIKKYLKTMLPEYMIPAQFVYIDKLPMNINGKLDRQKLKQLVDNNEEVLVLPENSLEKKLIKIWKEVLGVNKIGTNSDFFELGGDSLFAMKCVAKLASNGIIVSTQDFYDYPTIKELAQKVMMPKTTKTTKKKTKGTKEAYIENIDINNNANLVMPDGEILLLGATGFLGSHLLYDLLKETDKKIYCIVRGRSYGNARDRLLSSLKYYFNNEFEQYIDDRIIILRGDFTKERFGINEKSYLEIKSNVKTIINSAGTVKHYGSTEEFARSNISSVKNLIDFCIENNTQLVHVSTVSVLNGVSNKIHKDKKFNESNLYVGQELDENIYIKTKFEAEQLIVSNIPKGLNANIFRVGNIMWRSTDGVFQKNENENAFLNRLKSIINVKVVPEDMLKVKVDLSPVNECSKLIVNILLKENRLKLYHIYNGNITTIKNIISYLNGLGVNIEVVPMAKYKKLIKELMENKYELISGIVNDINKNYNEYANVNIEQTNTIGVLEDINFKWSKIDKKYLDKKLGVI